MMAQLSIPNPLSDLTKDYQSCAAIFFEGKMLVDKYAPSGKCKITKEVKGKFTLAAVELTDSSATPIQQIPFRVAIKNKATNTLWMYTQKSVQEILLEDLLMECQPGDKLLFLTEDKSYALPHNEVEVKVGC